MSDCGTWFDSLETGKPFSLCRVCQHPLPFSDSWIVNKHYHRGECILEYAVCEECRDQLSGRFSDESKQTIRVFLENEIPWDSQILKWMELGDVARRLDACVACQIPRSDMEAFTISAQFRADGSLIEGALPLLLCSACVNRITSSLSAESRAVWQDFLETHFEGPDSQTTDFGFF